LKTRKLLIAVLVLVLLAVYYIIGTGYLKQRHDNQALASRAGEAAQLLAQIPPFPTDLEQRLSAAQSGYAETQNSFPAPLNTTQIINGVLTLADEAGVKAVPLVTQPWTTENISDLNYSVFRLSVTATGDFTRVADFVDRLESDGPTTLVIESMLVDRITDAPGEEGTLSVAAQIEIVVYARPPAPDETGKDE
jgi:hypothetical protein